MNCTSMKYKGNIKNKLDIICSLSNFLSCNFKGILGYWVCFKFRYKLAFIIHRIFKKKIMEAIYCWTSQGHYGFHSFPVVD